MFIFNLKRKAYATATSKIFFFFFFFQQICIVWVSISDLCGLYMEMHDHVALDLLYEHQGVTNRYTQ